jgi:hypothetical protein
MARAKGSKVVSADVLAALEALGIALGAGGAKVKSKPSKAKKAAVKAAAKVAACPAGTVLSGEKAADIAALLREKAGLQAEKAVILAELQAGTRQPGDGAYRSRRLRIAEINSTLTKLGHKWVPERVAAVNG